jgi:hypothetical protein
LPRRAFVLGSALMKEPPPHPHPAEAQDIAALVREGSEAIAAGDFTVLETPDAIRRFVQATMIDRVTDRPSAA